MKGKWHINKQGLPAICKATKKACPLGEHYDTESQANKVAQKEFENEFGLLIDDEDMKIEKRKDMADLIQRISGIKSNGFDYECFASVSLAEKMGLNRVAITDRNGLVVNLSTEGTSKFLNAEVYVKRSIEGLRKYYEKMNIPIKDETLLSRVVYYSDDPEKGMLVQSGGSNVLDAAIIKADEVVDIIEMKELEKGAQLPLVSLNVDKNGYIEPESLIGQSEDIIGALRDVKIQDADGTNVKLEFGSEKKNIEHSLRYFVEEYKKKGATSFIYATNNGNTINTIDLTKETPEIIEEMLNKKIEASVSLRANLQRQNVTNDDIYRFNNILSKDYFKSGRASHTESFTLKSIKEDKISSSGKYVRVGGYILPIEYENYKDNLNKRIKKTDLKAFKLSLTGNIKTNY